MKENVGGETLEAALEHMNQEGRISVCGLVSEYNQVYNKSGSGYRGPSNFVRLFQCPHPVNSLISPFFPSLQHRVLTKRLVIKGFIVSDHRKECGPDFQRDMSEWIKKGEIKYREDVRPGIENAGTIFVDMLRGDNFGKMVVKVK